MARIREARAGAEAGRQSVAAPRRGRSCARPGLLALLCGLLAGNAAGAERVAIPNFWDPHARQERPDLPATRALRFLTDDEYPPLHFPGPDGTPTGFVIELARAACDRLGFTCTIQRRRFDTLLDSLGENRGDVVAAAVPLTAGLRQRFLATLPFFRLPARFAARLDRNQPEPSPKALEGRTVAVVESTAHAAFLGAFFPRAEAKTFPDLPGAAAALRRGETDYVFADGLGLALWVGGTEAAGCCALTGGPYLENRYFGEGIGFVLRKDEEPLRQALDYALQRLWDEGKYAELYLRFFPVSPF